MAADLTAFDKVLKEVYIPALRTQFNNSTILLSSINKSAEYMDGTGAKAIVPLKLGYSEGIGARAEGSVLPTAGSTRYSRLEIPVRTNYGVIQVTGHAIRQTAKDSGAFVRAVDSEMSNMMEGFKRDINRQLYGDATGAMATVTDNAVAGAAVTLTVSSVQYLRIGMYLDIYETAAQMTDTNAAVITAIDKTAVTITVAVLDNNLTAANTPTISRYGTKDIELYGLKNIVNTSNWLLNPATVPEWQEALAVEMPGAYTATEVLQHLQECYTNCETNGVAPNLAVTSYAIRDTYANSLTSLRRIVDKMDLEFGFKGLQFNGLPIVADDQCTSGYLYMLNTKYLAIPQSSEIEWADEDGKILDKVPSYDAYRAYMYWASNLVTTRRNVHSKITNW